MAKIRKAGKEFALSHNFITALNLAKRFETHSCFRS